MTADDSLAFEVEGLLPNKARGGQSVSLEWNLKVPENQVLSGVSIEISSDGETWTTIENDLQNVPTSRYDWNFPASLNGVYRVRVKAVTDRETAVKEMGEVRFDNLPPNLGAAGTVHVNEDSQVDFDIPEASDATAIRYRIVTPPAHGTLTGCAETNAVRSCHYVPAADYNGPDSFTYLAIDEVGNLTPSNATVNLVVDPINDPPAPFTPSCVSTVMAGNSFDCAMTGTDPEGDALTYTLDPSNGCSWLQINGNHLESQPGHPTAFELGACAARVRVTDGGTPAQSILLEIPVTVEGRPEISFAFASSSVSEGIGSAALVVNMSSPVSEDMRIDYAVTGGTASPADSSLTSGSVTVPAGQTAVALIVPITDDDVYENTETLTVGLSATSQPALGPTSSHTISILDNDAAPVFSIAGSAASEGAGSVSAVVTLSRKTEKAITYDWRTADSVASVHPARSTTAGADDADYGSVTVTGAAVPLGVTQFTVSVPLYDDPTDEYDEEFLAQLTAVSAGSIGTGSATMTIVNDDVAPTIEFASATSSISEVAANESVSVLLQRKSAKPITIDVVKTGGSADAPADYSISPAVLTLAPFQTAASFTFSPVNDGAPEGNETVVFGFTNAINTSIGATASHTVTIVDGPRYQIFTASGTFSVPGGISSVRVVVVGGGGGGGGTSCGWGSGAGGGCGGGVVASTVAVTPGSTIPVTVGSGGAAASGCGDGGSGSGSSFGGLLTADGGSWGRSGYNNLFGSYTGGSGGGSGGGGGGNGWPGYAAVPGNGGTAGGQTNSTGAGGACTGGGWSSLAGYITEVSYSAGTGGYAPGSTSYWGGGGGGGLILDGSTVAGGDCANGAGRGGAGYGGGGSGSDGSAAPGAGAAGVVYVEW